MGHKEDEIRCLNWASSKTNQNKGSSKKILRFLSCPDFSEAEQEHPDFIKMVPSEGNGKATLLGIEHFAVNHYSKKIHENGEKYEIGSTGTFQEKRILKMQKDHIESDDNPEDAFNNVINNLRDVISDLNCIQGSSIYPNLIDAFDYSLTKHVKKIDDYQSTLKKLSYNRFETKLMFLIEIRTWFPSLFLHNNLKINSDRSGIAPLFDDYIRLIEEKDPKERIDYIVFCVTGVIATNKHYVVAVKRHHIRRELEKMHIPVYTYCGEDAYLRPFEGFERNHKVKAEAEIKATTVDFHLIGSYDKVPDDVRMYSVLHNLYNMSIYIKQGKPVVTDMIVESFYESLTEYITDWHWQNTDYGSFIVPTIIPESYCAVMEKFKIFEGKLRKLGIIRDTDSL